MRCGLVQLISNPAIALLASAQPTDEGLGQQLMHKYRLGAHHLVLAMEGSSPELLRQLIQAGVRVVYLEAHPERRKAASSNGIPTRQERFDRNHANQLLEEGMRADLVLGNQLLVYHSDLNGLLGSLAAVLKVSGLLVLEMPYLRDMLEARQFEHFTHHQQHYFSVSALEELVRRHGLWLQRVDRLSDGYLRYCLGKAHQWGILGRLVYGGRAKAGSDRGSLLPRVRLAHCRCTQSIGGTADRTTCPGRRVAAYGANPQSTALLMFTV